MGYDATKLDANRPPEAVVAELAAGLRAVRTETIDLSLSAGRVLARPIGADRDSPACDVSAMDGYAVRIADVARGTLPVTGEARIGQPPSTLPPAAAVKIVTGAPVPAGAQAVIRREAVQEHPDHIVIPPGTVIAPGQDIRTQGQNIRGGEVVIDAGTLLNPAMVSALAGFGAWRPVVYRPLRLGVIVTGDELLAPDLTPSAWQLRDSNGPAVEAMFASCPWIDWQQMWQVVDDLEETRSALVEALESCDAVLMTGGVSMGDRDYAQVAVEQLGARIAFHGLPIRPGKPMLGAVGPQGQPILGLPGNPVSVLVTARRLASIVLRKVAGFAQIDPPAPLVQVDQPDLANPELWLYRPVRFTGPGVVQILPTKGSGDLVSSARSDGFVEIAPDTGGQAMRAFYAWAL